jgi:hypothetical protein
MPGCDAKDVTAGGGESPHREPGRVDARQSRGESDRGPPVGELILDRQDLARFPAAFPDAEVVEGEDGEPGVVEAPRE